MLFLVTRLMEVTGAIKHWVRTPPLPQTKNKGEKTLLSNLWASSFSAGEDRPARAGELIR